MHRESRGYTLVELMIVVAVVGVLAGIAIPMFTAQAGKAKGTEAVLQLEKLAKNATLYHSTNHKFPIGTAAVLPAADGEGCKAQDRKMAASTQWDADPMWSALDFDISEPTRFSYHYEATGPHSARAWATADLGCSGNLVTYEIVLEGSCDGDVAWILIDPTSHGAAAMPAKSTDCDDDTDSGSSSGSASGGGSSSGGGSASSGGSANSGGAASGGSSGSDASSSSGGSSSSANSGSSGGGLSGGDASNGGSSGNSGASNGGSSNAGASNGGSSGNSGSSGSSGGTVTGATDTTTTTTTSDEGCNGKTDGTGQGKCKGHDKKK